MFLKEKKQDVCKFMVNSRIFGLGSVMSVSLYIGSFSFVFWVFSSVESIFRLNFLFFLFYNFKGYFPFTVIPE